MQFAGHAEPLFDVGLGGLVLGGSHTVRDPADGVWKRAADVEGAAIAPAGFDAARDGDHWRISLTQAQSSQDALRAAIDAGAPITSFTPEEARLRDVFVSLVSEAEAQDLTDTLAADAAQGRDAA